MIISASRRTDIPSYYSEWFINRIKEGFVYVRNPMNIHQVSKISLSPDVVDGIVFWTKNPIPMMDKLDFLGDYAYYFQFTVNSYAHDIEPHIPNKNNIIIPAFKNLSNKIGKERVIWRYDPILLTEKYTIEYHLKYFEEIAKRLSGYTSKCIISFVDLYRNTQSNMKNIGLLPLGTKEMLTIAEAFVDIADQYSITIESCAEKIDLEQFGIAHGHCIDCNLLEEILGCRLDLSKDKNQREECGCAASIDIGMYNTCKNGCRYCYATYSDKTVKRLSSEHDPHSPLISGQIGKDDVIKERDMHSCRKCQLNLFDQFNSDDRN